MTVNTNPRINGQIRIPKVRLIDQNGTNVGIVPVKEAQTRAEKAQLDLVEINAETKPPVVKIMDYGKFRYEQSKQDREKRKKSHAKALKEIKFSVRIGEGDYTTKVNRVRDFLENGHKVQLTIQMRGREQVHPDLGVGVLNRVIQEVEAVGKADKAPQVAGRRITALLNPKA